jgi:guanylate kinase
MSNRGELYVIAAPSGTGKTSLIRALLQRMDRLALSVSDTTRPPRAKEVDGQQYHFLDQDAFRRGIAENRYLEHAEVFGNLYGTSRDRVQKLWDEDRDVLLEIDVQGAEQVIRHFPEACTIFILPPSMATLGQRLTDRNSDSPAVIRRRLGEARREIEACSGFRWLVVNDDFDRALEELVAIISAWPLRQARRASRVRQLLDETPPDLTIEGYFA